MKNYNQKGFTNNHKQQEDSLCPVDSQQQGALPAADVNRQAVVLPPTATLKVPVVLAEKTLQIVIEAEIPLNPGASEIKHVHKNVFLDQVKLVPVAFDCIGDSGYFAVTRAKLFVSGYIRKNIEYASNQCNGLIYDRIATTPFTGYVELTEDDFIVSPIFAANSDSRAQFLSDKNGLVPRLDKYYFQHQVNYNEQPYGELISAEFYELDFSPVKLGHQKAFCSLREKIVMDLTLKVLQLQQIQVNASQVIPTTSDDHLC